MHLVHAFIAVSGTSAGLSQILRNGGLHRQNMAFSHELKHSVKPSRSARKSVKMLTSSDQNDRSSMSETKSMASRGTSKKSSTGTSPRHTLRSEQVGQKVGEDAHEQRPKRRVLNVRDKVDGLAQYLKEEQRRHLDEAHD